MKSVIQLLISNLIVSTLFGLISLLSGSSFLYVFLFSFLIQYVLYGFIAKIIVNFFREKTKQLEISKLENLSTILECSYCNSKNILTFIPDQNEKLEFTCSSCNKLNSVIMQFTVIKQNETLPISSLLKDDENENQ
jgi:transcription elongation factor Elf1